MLANIPILRSSTPGCSRSVHPDVEDPDIRMYNQTAYYIIENKILTTQKRLHLFRILVIDV